jgi:serine/threonine protein kinase
MGEVFLAEDSSLNRNVALKFLPEGLQKDEIARERFLREARSAAALDHPYICKIYEIGEVDGKAFIAMEYVEGVTLQDKLRQGALGLADVLQIGIEIGEAVEAAHKKQIIHRDLKTPNIMVTLDGHIKVMDFGLAKQIVLEHARDSSVDTMSAKLTEDGSTPGTVIYMSPEQVRGELLDTRSDIFSVGVLLYEIASGRVPFQGATSGLTYDAILNRGPVPLRQSSPDMPVELEQIIGKALEKDREVRYQNIRELVVDLKRLRRDSDTETIPYSEMSTSSPAAPAGRFSRPVLAVIGGVSVAVLVIGWLMFGGGPAGLGGDRLAITSLAVLPFENTRNDPDVDYLADGIAESLINQLSQLPQLSVMARSTAFRYRGDVDPQKVGDELGVRAVLTGRVVQQGDILNVQAELVDTEKGTQLWGQQYEYPLDDLLSVQSDLAAEISQALRLQLTGEEEAQIAVSGTADSEAYQSYLRGRFLWGERTNENFVAAIDFFEEARQKDPNYALAYAGLADSYFLLGAQFYGADENYRR